MIGEDRQQEPPSLPLYIPPPAGVRTNDFDSNPAFPSGFFKPVNQCPKIIERQKQDLKSHSFWLQNSFSPSRGIWFALACTAFLQHRHAFQHLETCLQFK